MPTSFENFVNTELPKRIATNESPTTPQAGDIPVFSGVGLLTESKTASEAGLATETFATNAANTAETSAKSYADGLITSIYNFQTTYDPQTTGNFPTTANTVGGVAIKKGFTWVVSGVTGQYTFQGVTVDNGDTLLALVDNASATSAADWHITEKNLGYTPENSSNKYSNNDLAGGAGTYPATPSVKAYVDNGLSGKQNTLADVITANTYGSSTQYPVITFNAKGIATGVTLQTVPIPTFTDANFSVQKNGSPSIAASWDLTALTASVVHTYPNKAIDFKALSSIGASDGNTLSGTRTRILGGSGNNVSGTDNVAIASKNCTLAGTGNRIYGCSALDAPSSLSNCTFNSVLNEYGAAYGNSYVLPLFSNASKTNTLDGVIFSGWLNPVVASVQWPKGYEVRGYKTTTLQNIKSAVHTKAYVILNTVAGQPNADVVIADDTSRKPVGLCDEVFTPFVFVPSNKNSCHRLRINGYISGAGSFTLEREIFVTGNSGAVQIRTPVADYVDAAVVTLTVTASVAAATTGGFYRDLTINVSHDHSLAGYILGTGTLESNMFNVLIAA